MRWHPKDLVSPSVQPGVPVGSCLALAPSHTPTASLTLFPLPQGELGKSTDPVENQPTSEEEKFSRWINLLIFIHSAPSSLPGLTPERAREYTQSSGKVSRHW